MNDDRCFVCVDMGTTNTRVWMVRGAQVLARGDASVGARDTAREGTNAIVRRTLRDLIERVKAAGGARQPECVLACGMITSPLGLAEVPHVPAPAGAGELAAGIVRRNFADVCDLEVWLVPGVRSLGAGADGDVPSSIGEQDVMRGEETLCVGLPESGALGRARTVLNLGSHWKVIRLDSEDRIAASLTSIGGELLHLAQTGSVLASAVPHARATTIDESWLRAGMSEQRQAGLARALFCVRLLEQARSGTPDDRLSYLVGAFVASDLDALVRRRALRAGEPVAVVAKGGIGAAWALALAEANITSHAVNEQDAERALLIGLRRIAAARLEDGA